MLYDNLIGLPKLASECCIFLVISREEGKHNLCL